MAAARLTDESDGPPPLGLALAHEFRAKPLGPHGAALAAVLSRLRAGPVAGKYCLICVKPHAEWMVGRMSGERGVPPSVALNQVFHRIEDAEWAVFKLRWRDAGGPEIDEDPL